MRDNRDKTKIHIQYPLLNAHRNKRIGISGKKKKDDIWFTKFNYPYACPFFSISNQDLNDKLTFLN